MTPTPHVPRTEVRWHDPRMLAAILLAGGMGALANTIQVPFFDEASAKLGMPFAFAAALALGPIPGALAMLLSGLTVPSWYEYPVMAAMAATVAATVSVFARRGRLPVTGVLAFWSISGPPVVLIYVAAGYPMDRVVTQILAGIVNGLLGVMAADVLLTTRGSARILEWVGRRERWRLPLRAQLTNWFITISALPIFAIGLAGARWHSLRLERDARTRLTERSASLARNARDFVAARRQLIELLGQGISREGLPRNRAAIQARLDEFSHRSDGFLTVIAANERGDLIASSRGGKRLSIPAGANLADRPYFIEAMRTGRSYVSGVFRGRGVSNEPVVAISAPLLVAGKPVGILQGTLDPRRVARFAESNDDIEDGSLIVVDADERVVVARTRSGDSVYASMTSLHRSPLLRAADTAAAVHLASYQDAGTPQHPGVEYLVGVAVVPSLGWRVLQRQPLAAIRQDAARFFIAAIVLMFAAIFVSIGIATALSRRVTVPLEQLVREVDGFAAHGRRPAPIAMPVGSPREIGTLIEDVGTIIARLIASSDALKGALRDREAANGELEGVLHHLDDLVKERTAQLADATERAQAGSLAKSRFLATMSHEIRTPLNGVIGLLDELVATPLTDDQRGYVTVMQDSAWTLRALLNDALDYSKIEAGRLVLEESAFAPDAVAREVVGLMSAATRRDGTTLVLAAAGPLPHLVSGDAHRVRQVLLNLVGNAIRFAKQGRVDVRLSIPSACDGDGLLLRGEVEDNGIGIDAGQMARLFQPFTQADESTSRVYGGSGLGLAICRELVEQMGGEIGVDSVMGYGSRFWFTVRVRRVSVADTQLPLALPATAPVRDLRTLPWTHGVLVVDDNEANRLVAGLALKRLGVPLTLAAAGDDAVSLASIRRYDLILMDCQMPEVDGLEATRRIRAAEQAQGHTRVPVVAFTASDSQQAVDRCLDAGFDDVLQKPFRPESMAAMLCRWVGGDHRTLRGGEAAAPGAPEPAPVPVDASAPIDFEQLCALDRATPTGLVRQLVAVFEQSSVAHVDALRPAAEHGDGPAIARHAHALKGAALNLGAVMLADACRTLEQVADGSTPDDVVRVTQRVAVELDRATEALRNWLDQAA